MYSKVFYNTLFYFVLASILYMLFLQTNEVLSISYKEALNYFENISLLTILTRISTTLFGQNDLALRLPFVVFYCLSVIFMYKIIDDYFKTAKDRFISIFIFMLLPGLLSAALLVNSAIVVTFLTIFYIYYYKVYKKHLYYALPFFLLVDNSFTILFLALFFYSFKDKDKKLLYISLALFVISFFVYEFRVDGRPQGFLLDTFGIYAAIFSPILFLYFLYAIYRTAVIKNIDLIWYISATALLLSIVASFRQKIYIEDFAPFVVIFVPTMMKIFLHSYRVRLKEFRKNYNIFIYIVLFFLFLNILLTFVNKPIYLLLDRANKHFVYEYHFAKEIAEELKKREMTNVVSPDKHLLLRLRFYKIEEYPDYFISQEAFYNYDEKITIKYYNKDIVNIYVKKL
ncbi:glycosyltransferase family 39 protein [Arcobacter porcinus]|uniref:glycosyltransferase family 39 protein n=1 Tax=Arcobacter porcinus TaxID=1935204 RepID=UPI00081EE8BF|nr:glycosyltransferase family 39 protein [Arcobacter porcinus]OCL84471.1 hypothetical protein AAW29_00144 [Arcobacter porcinus]OCL89012.1 hypothetical protein AAX30_00144 [Arcobacter porcinus]